MASSDRRRGGTFAAFRRPFPGDPVFWLTFGFALLAGVVVGGGLLIVMGVPDRALVWLWPIAGFVIAGWLAFKLLAMGITTSRALDEAASPPDDARARSMEAGGRAAGAALGKGARLLLGLGRGPTSASPSPAAEPTSTAPDSSAAPAAPVAPSAPSPTTAAPAPSSDVTVDQTARVLGAMVGRRLGGRKQP